MHRPIGVSAANIMHRRARQWDMACVWLQFICCESDWLVLVDVRRRWVDFDNLPKFLTRHAWSCRLWGQITNISSTLVYYGCSVHAFEAVNRLCVESRVDHPEALPDARRTTSADALYWPPIQQTVWETCRCARSATPLLWGITKPQYKHFPEVLKSDVYMCTPCPEKTTPVAFLL